MDPFARDDLKDLLSSSAEHCISLYLPTHRAPVEGRQDLIRFKNMVREAEERLVQRGLRGPEAKKFVAPLKRLQEDTAFWQYRCDGVAVFKGEELMRHYRLPIRFEELVAVGPRFHLKPLIPLFTEESGFFVLALSQNTVRLIQANRYSAWEVKLENIPASVADALQLDTPERELQFRGKASSGAGGSNPVYFAHGGVECCKEEIRRYFHQIDKGLQEVLRPHGFPLLLAGVEYLLPIYREVNTYPNLLAEGIAGNPELLSAEALQAHAWEMLQPYFLKARGEMMAQFNRLAGTGRTSQGIEEILPAASRGQVEKLLVATGVQVRGTYDIDSQVVELQDNSGNGSTDLLDLAAVQAVLNGAKVYTADRTAMPGDAPIAAIMRY